MTEATRLDPPSLEISSARATIRLHRSHHRNRIEPGEGIRMMEQFATLDAGKDLLRIGNLTHYFPADRPDAAVEHLAGTLTFMAPLTVQGMRQALNGIGHGAFDMEACSERVRSCKESTVIHDGLAAFREKRAPVFQGR